MPTKNKIKKIADDTSNTFSEGDIILLQKIELARQQVKEGEFLTEEELDKEINSWN